MDENDIASLDLEYKRYLQLLRPYLLHINEDKVVKLCDAWIQRLSDVANGEKTLRNKYIFLLCYQLAKGVFGTPFVHTPPSRLQPLSDDVNSDDSSTEIEELVVNVEAPKTRILYDRKRLVYSESDYLSQGSDRLWNGNTSENEEKYTSTGKGKQSSKLLKYYRNMESNTSDHIVQIDDYESRANNLVQKLREIKMQNMILTTELMALKQDTKCEHEELTEHYAVKVDNATSPFLHKNESSATFKSLRYQLQEVHDSRNNLLETINNLQNQLNTFNELKKSEINDIEAKHKLELIKLRTDAREETKLFYEKQLEEINLKYETTISKMKGTSETETKAAVKAKEEVIEEKNKLLESKDQQINGLMSQIEAQKTSAQSIFNRFFEKSSDDVSCEALRMQNQLLEKRLNKVEKSKLKCARLYETKLIQLQRDKHLAECSLQLQLIRQRAHVVSELANENQNELTASLDKLEGKYKDIVANVQATAIQRRIQDQRALECLLQTACGLEEVNQFGTPARNYSQSYESDSATFQHNNRVNNALGNKSFGEDSVLPGYCLNGGKVGELLERLYVPHRDTCNPETK